MRTEGVGTGTEEEPIGEALRFLLTALGAIGLLSLAHTGLQLLLAPAEGDEIGALAAPFRRGFLLSDPHALVPSGIGMPARVGAALVAGLGGACCGALTGAVLAALRSRSRRPAALLGARIGFVVIAAWAIWAALAMPVEWIKLEHSGLTIRSRASLWGMLAVPGATRAAVHGWDELEGAAPDGLDGPITVRLKQGAMSIAIAPAARPEDTVRLRDWLQERVQRR